MVNDKMSRIQELEEGVATLGLQLQSTLELVVDTMTIAEVMDNINKVKTMEKRLHQVIFELEGLKEAEKNNTKLEDFDGNV